MRIGNIPSVVMLFRKICSCNTTNDHRLKLESMLTYKCCCFEKKTKKTPQSLKLNSFVRRRLSEYLIYFVCMSVF